MDIFLRSRLILGDKSQDLLKQKTIAIFGLGGVGSYASEAIARSGIGKIILIDNDVVDATNINRQLVALHSTIGMYKTHVMKQRILDINPDAQVITHETFILPSDDGFINRTDIIEGCDYIIDAIDTISAKIALTVTAQHKNIPLISAMGCGNKKNPLLFKIEDIYNTSVCPLCKVMRRELKKREIKQLKVVYSTEQTIAFENPSTTEQIIGSLPWVPSVAGLIMAGYVIQEIVEQLNS